MHYITAAYDNPVYLTYLKGFVNSFLDHNDAPLTVYTDMACDWMPRCVEVVNEPVIQFVDKMVEIHPQTNQRIKYSWAKVDLLFSHICEYSVPTCWIDVDMLVVENLNTVVHRDKINVISYGFGDNIRDCGDGIKVKQSDYVKGGFFSFPDTDRILEFYQVCWTPVTNPGDLMEQAVCEQSALNRFIIGRNDVLFLDKYYGNEFYFNLAPWNGHITQEGPIQRLRFENNVYTVDGQQIALFYFMSHQLDKFINNGFACIQDKVARKRLKGYYK